MIFIKFNLYLVNLIIFIINFLLLYKRKTIKEKIKTEDIKINFRFKNAEEFLYFIFKKYNQISNCLNEKYKYKIAKNVSKNNKFYKKKKISLYSVDLFNPKLHRLWLKNKLKKRFRIKFNKYNPDYLIYNVFGNEHINERYSNSIKIAIFTENRIPDLSTADYAIGHSHIKYLDRYFKFPLFLWKNINLFGLIIFILNYKKVDMGGIYLNNVGGPIANKIEFLSSYKFSIAMENTEGDGYISEKIYDSFISGTIPIYYGDYTIDEYINPKSFILFIY